MFGRLFSRSLAMTSCGWGMDERRDVQSLLVYTINLSYSPARVEVFERLPISPGKAN